MQPVACQRGCLCSVPLELSTSAASAAPALLGEGPPASSERRVWDSAACPGRAARENRGEGTKIRRGLRSTLREKNRCQTARSAECHPTPPALELPPPDRHWQTKLTKLSQPLRTMMRGPCHHPQTTSSASEQRQVSFKTPAAPAPAQPCCNSPECGCVRRLHFPAVQSVTRPQQSHRAKGTELCPESRSAEDRAWQCPRSCGTHAVERGGTEPAALQSSQMCPSCGVLLTGRAAARAPGPSHCSAGTAWLRWGSRTPSPSSTPRSARAGRVVTGGCKEADGNNYPNANSMEISMCLGRRPPRLLPGQGFTAVSRDCDSELALSHGWCLNASLEPPI